MLRIVILRNLLIVKEIRWDLVENKLKDSVLRWLILRYVCVLMVINYFRRGGIYDVGEKNRIFIKLKILRR